MPLAFQEVGKYPDYHEFFFQYSWKLENGIQKTHKLNNLLNFPKNISEFSPFNSI